MGTRVIVADDYCMVRLGLSAMLQVWNEFEIVGFASSGEEAVRLCDALAPDVLIIDLLMPNCDTPSVINDIKTRQPRLRVLVLACSIEETAIRNAIHCGANGYILKSVSTFELADAVRAVQNGQVVIAPEAAAVLLKTYHDTATHPSLRAALSDREAEVLSLIVRGLSNAEIAHRLGLSTLTIKNHVRNIFAKIGVSSRTEAATYALQHGMVPPTPRETR